MMYYCYGMCGDAVAISTGATVSVVSVEAGVNDDKSPGRVWILVKGLSTEIKNATARQSST